MALPNIFSQEVTASIIERIQKLTPESKPLWGKMSVSQMLAHCCVTYRYVYEPQNFKRPNFLMAWVLKKFIKNTVTNEIPYKKNTGTAPDFIIKDDRNFNQEKTQLIDFIKRVQKEGAATFDGKESFSFGKLSIEEWNNMFYKHLNHHLTQFGV
ncbi:MAG: DUF1569 domain-containing protein [Saprospiraceae bacterium]|nr:DUF1569 domain-containing protein [Saprospiraceae bacterium]